MCARYSVMPKSEKVLGNRRTAQKKEEKVEPFQFSEHQKMNLSLIYHELGGLQGGRERCKLSMFSREQTLLGDSGEQSMTPSERFRCADVQLGSFCFSLSTWPDFGNSKVLKIYYRNVCLLPGYLEM